MKQLELMSKSELYTLMKKCLSVLLFFLVSTVVTTAQHKYHTCGDFEQKRNIISSCQDESHYLFNENGDKIHDEKLEFIDRFGKRYHRGLKKNKNQNRAANIPVSPDYVSPEGLFALYITDAQNNVEDFTSNTPQGEAYRDVLAQVFADLEVLIEERSPNTSPEGRVNIEIQSIHTNSGALASATSYYDYNGLAIGAITEGEVWKAINSNTNDPDEWDGFISVNFHHSWYTDFNHPENIGGTYSFDLYAVLLHEVLHALGFASGIGENGLPKNGQGYFPYDNLLHTVDGEDLLIANGTAWSLDSILLSNLTDGCPASGNISLGSNDLFVHNPSVFSNGSSLSHIDINNDCAYPVSDYIMAFGVAIETPRRLHEDEFKILCELNYSLSNHYGHTNIVKFDNPAIVTTDLNNNTLNISACNPVVFGLDDFQDPATRPTIENCSGNVLLIMESELLQNDLPFQPTGQSLMVSELSTLD